MTLDQKKELYLRACKAYFNKKEIMTDAAFDALEKEIRLQEPKWRELKNTGAKPDKKTEIALTYFMPSLHKYYPEKIAKWLAKQDDRLLVMDKLDGSSIQIEYNRGLPDKVVTRGDGTNGGDISFLISYLKIPKRIAVKQRTVFRCEAVMKREIFETKYRDQADNARALVNGLLNRMKPSPILKDVDIVVLGQYGASMIDTLKEVKSCGFDVVRHNIVSTVESIKALQKRRQSSVYDMDGLVLCRPDVVLEYANADKPKFMIAYKENTNLADAHTTKVVKIVWQKSRLDRWIPKVEIEPVQIGGTTITYATCHNAQWMIDRSIGPGAVIQIVRSGDVIPKIVNVSKRGRLQLPEGETKMIGVHLMAIERSIESEVKTLHNFFTVLGIEFIASKTIEKLYAQGFQSIEDYLKLYYSGGVSDLVAAGLGEGMSKKICDELHRVFGQGVLLRDLMVASNCFDAGIGDRKLKSIQTHYGDNVLVDLVKTVDKEVLTTKLMSVPGLANISAQLIKDGIVKFRPFLRMALKYIKISKPQIKKVVDLSMTAIKVSFTTYRDKEHEKFIIDRGGEVISFGAKTQYLIYKQDSKENDKLAKARAKGIKVMTFDQLVKGLK